MRVEGRASQASRMEKYTPFETYLLSTDPVWVWNSDSRSIVWANSAAKSLWGAPVGLAFQSLQLPEKSPALKRLTDVARRENGAGQWSGSLSFSAAGGKTTFSCQLQKLELIDGQKGVIVRMQNADAKAKQNGAATSPRTAIQPKSPPARLKSAAKKAPLPEKKEAAGKPAIAKKSAVVAKSPPGKGATEAAPKSPKARQFRPKAADLAYLAGLSHDLRNPLTAIIGFADILKNATPGSLSPEKMTEYAADISRSAMFALDLANDLLGYARSGPPAVRPLEPTALSASDVAAECLRLVAPLAHQASLSASLTASEKLPGLKIQERSLKQILLNLLLNSIKFTAPGGQVRLKIALDRAGALIITISDTGGASEASSIRVGGAVVTTSAGIGLAMVKCLLKDVGGRLHRRKRPGGGVAMKLIFPASALATPG